MIHNVIEFFINTYYWVLDWFLDWFEQTRIDFVYSYRAGRILGERRALTGEGWTDDELRQLANRLLNEDTYLEEHRRRREERAQ